jgi:plasmid maintenance system antidote protein VapI
VRVNWRYAISAEVARRVGKWVGNGPEIWLRMQGQYELWQAKKKRDPKINKAKRPVVASALPA